MILIQGCTVSRYSLNRAWIEDIFRRGVGLARHIYGCRSVSRVEKIHFAFTNNTFCVSTGLETVSESVSKDTLMCVEHNLTISLRGPHNKRTRNGTRRGRAVNGICDSWWKCGHGSRGSTYFTICLTFITSGRFNLNKRLIMIT